MSTAQQRQIAARKQARHYAVQALYQWQMTATSAKQIEAEFRGDYDMSKVDSEFFQELVAGAINASEALLGHIGPLLDRELDDLDTVEKAILLVGTFELAERIDVPYKVVINEHVNLAKKFGATESHKYINGVLDQLAKQLRVAETGA